MICLLPLHLTIWDVLCLLAHINMLLTQAKGAGARPKKHTMNLLTNYRHLSRSASSLWSRPHTFPLTHSIKKDTLRRARKESRRELGEISTLWVFAVDMLFEDIFIYIHLYIYICIPHELDEQRWTPPFISLHHQTAPETQHTCLYAIGGGGYNSAPCLMSHVIVRNNNNNKSCACECTKPKKHWQRWKLQTEQCEEIEGINPQEWARYRK